MIDVIIEPHGFLAFDIFKEILKNRLIDYQTINDTPQNKENIVTGEHFLCSESFEKELGGQPKLLEIDQKHLK